MGTFDLTYPYPLQVWQFGQNLTFVAMGGEVPSECALQTRTLRLVDLGNDREQSVRACCECRSWPKITLLCDGQRIGTAPSI